MLAAANLSYWWYLEKSEREAGLVGVRLEEAELEEAELELELEEAEFEEAELELEVSLSRSVRLEAHREEERGDTWW